MNFMGIIKEKMTKKIMFILSLTILLTSTFSISYAKDMTDEEVMNNLKYLYDDIKNSYYGEGYDTLDNKKLYEAMAKGLFSVLDPYSTFYTDEEFKIMQDDMKTTTYGLGVVVTKRDNTFVITDIYKDSGAEKAGIKLNDQIIKVDGVDISNLSLDELVARVKGEKDTKVNITVNRSGSIITYTVTRCELSEDPTEAVIASDLTGEEIDKNTLYLSLDNFNEGAYDFMLDKLEEIFKKNDDVDSLVLDLRNNGGGYTNEALNIISLLLDYDEKILTLEDKEKNQLTYMSKNKHKFFDKIVVLVNHNTASASEVTTGALRDNKKAIVIGENTYGKNVSQVIHDIKDKHYKLTTEVYYTPSGQSVYKKGITPDIIMEEPKFIYDVKYKYYGNEESDDILAAKSMLKYLGYNITDDSKKYDTNTFNMVSKFQADNGLGAYGGLDYTTQRKLNEMALNKFQNDKSIIYKAIEVIRNWDTYKNNILK